MKQRYQASLRQGGFSLLELLAVITVIAVLSSLAVLSFRGINSSGNFNRAVDEISGILEQGRSYAMAQNTYVWIVLYENVPGSSSPPTVFVTGFASGDGTDPFAWSATPATVSVPPGTINGTTLSQFIRVHRYKGLNLETTNLPNATGSPGTPATNPATAPATAAPVFQLTAQSDSGPVQLTNAGSGNTSTYWLIQFTPTGAARNSANPIDSVWLGLQPSLPGAAVDTHNVASIKISGLTGAVAIYRN